MQSPKVSRENVHNLVPITREVLKKYYEGYPPVPLTEETKAIRQEVESHCRKLGLSLNYDQETDDSGSSSARGRGVLNQRFGQKVLKHPHKTDENVWRSRQQLEEILYLLEPQRFGTVEAAAQASKDVSFGDWTQAVEEIKKVANASFERLQNFQKSGMKKVSDLIATFLPNDFRMSIVKSQQERSEAKREAMIKSLVEQGGSIQEKYDLYWKLQLERRQTLVNIGNATGAYKAIIKYIGGVPQVLLDFIKTVNDNNGPMEELRATYGPKLYFLTEFVNSIYLLLACTCLVVASMASSSSSSSSSLSSSSGSSSSSSSESTFSLTKEDREQLEEARKAISEFGVVEQLRLVERALRAYDREIDAYLTQQLEILEHSPFFVTKDATAAMVDDSSEDEKEVVVAKMHEIRIRASPGDEVVWEFSTKSKDIEFFVEFHLDEGGGGGEGGEIDKIVIKERERVNSHLEKVKGSHMSERSGLYRLVWDNSYSWLAKKTLVYKAYRKALEEGEAKNFEETLNEIVEEQEEETTA